MVVLACRNRKCNREMELINTVECENWQAFVQCLMGQPYLDTLLWRGQSDAEWEITPSYTRETEKKIKNLGPGAENNEPGWSRAMYERISQGVDLSKDYETLLRLIPKDNLRFDIGARLLPNQSKQESLPLTMYLERYYNALNSAKNAEDKNLYQRFGTPYDVTFGIDVDLEMWTWGQHYGVETPLVDWTEHALFALFFACDAYKDARSISVFSLDMVVLENLNCCNYPASQENSFIPFHFAFFSGIPIWAFHDNKDKTNIEQGTPLFDDMRKMKLIRANEQRLRNDRCSAQAGWFTFTPGGISIEEWCRRCEAAFSGFQVILEGRYLITKYVFNFTKIDRRNCLDFLNKANINAMTLYPDFYGISRYLHERRQRRADLRKLT